VDAAEILALSDAGSAESGMRATGS